MIGAIVAPFLAGLLLVGFGFRGSVFSRAIIHFGSEFNFLRYSAGIFLFARLKLFGSSFGY